MDPLHSLIKHHQDSDWQLLGISRDWTFEVTTLDVLGANAKKYMILFRSEDGTLQQKLLLKQYDQNSVRFSTVQNEFRGLNATYKAFITTPCFRAPRPYGLILKDKILFMEYCPSTNLSKILWKSLKLSRLIHSHNVHENLLNTAAQMGRMLAEFQKVPIDTQSVVGDGVWSEKHFLGYLEACKNLGIPNEIIHKVKYYVLQRLHSIDSGLMVSQHCDFGPWNILIAKTFVYLTDFGNFMTGFPAYDAAFFYTSLDLFTRYKTVDKSLVCKMQASFLNAFIDHHSFTENLRPVPSLFDAFCVIHMCFFASLLLGARMRPYSFLYAGPPMRFLAEWFADHVKDSDVS